MAVSGIRKFLDFVGNMGLLARGDRPKVVELTGREWGAVVGGFSLSARQEAKQDSEELPTVSAVLRNESPAPLTIHVPGWLAFYELRVLGPDGAEVPHSAYGTHLLNASKATENVELPLAAGAVTETILPVGSLYSMRVRGEYKVYVSCRLPDGTQITSNVAVVRP